jgi:hypothetical protein
MAPEQFTGNATQASDFYALGVVLLVLLTRKEPEELSDNGLELNWREYIYASDKVIHLLERLLENDPKKRIKTLKEIENILNNNTDEMVIKNTPKKEVIRKEPASIGYNTNIYQEEFKRIDSKFAGISEESNYKHWKGNLDAILGFMMFGIAGAGWWYYTWYMGLLFGFMFVIVFMLLTNSLYKRKARAFLEIFVSKIDSDNNRDLTFAILNSWGKKQDLGDEFLSELNSYITKEVGKGRIDIQRLNEYKTEIENDPIYQKFTETYIKELYPDS